MAGTPPLEATEEGIVRDQKRGDEQPQQSPSAHEVHPATQPAVQAAGNGAPQANGAGPQGEYAKPTGCASIHVTSCLRLKKIEPNALFGVVIVLQMQWGLLSWKIVSTP